MVFTYVNTVALLMTMWCVETLHRCICIVLDGRGWVVERVTRDAIWLWLVGGIPPVVVVVVVVVVFVVVIHLTSVNIVDTNVVG